MRPSRPGSVLVQKSCHVEFDELLRWMYSTERENRCIGKVLEWYRGEDAGDLERVELPVLVENWRHLNDPGRKICKINLKILMEEKSWKTWKSVMDGKFVKNFVMDAKIDPKVVMDLSVFKTGGWNTQ